MQKNTQFYLALAVIIVLAFIFFLIKNKKESSKENPYEYSVEEFKQVDEADIAYIEIKRIKLTEPNPVAFTYHQKKIYVLSKERLQIIDKNGQEAYRMSLDDTPLCLGVTANGEVIVVFENHLAKYNSSGNMLLRSETLPENSAPTSIAISGQEIFIADGGRKEVLVFDTKLNLISSFKGESGASSLHGFILPGMQFYLAVNQEGELWTTNPGMHVLQNYTPTGRLRGSWGQASFGSDGFSGCCNPSYFGFLSDGNFVTSEKGMVRVKIHHESGEFLSYVAAPESFPNGNEAPAIAVDESDHVLLLDFEQQNIRIFEPKQSMQNNEN